MCSNNIQLFVYELDRFDIIYAFNIYVNSLEKDHTVLFGKIQFCKKIPSKTFISALPLWVCSQSII